ncbi:MAG: ABC transporter substrate-binding protein, partial [Pedobacter sp.]
TVGVMQNNSEENYNPLQPITSGKFKIVKIERSGPIVKEVILWNSNDDEDIKKLAFRYYVNESELASGARLGEIDGFIAHDNPDLQDFTEYKYPLQGVYYALYFNLRKETLQDAELRQKLEKVLNLPSMVAEMGIVVEGPISRSIFTDRAIKFDKYERGFTEDLSGKSLVITVPDIQEHVDMAEKIAEVWQEKLGIKVEVKAVNPSELVDSVIKNRDFDVLFYGQEVGRDPDRYVNWHSTQKDFPGLNLSGFDHVRSDRALEEGRKEVDNDKRIIHYDEFQKVIVDQVPAIFLYHPYTRYFVSNYIEGIGEKYTFTMSDRFLDFYNWKRVKTL